MDTFKISNLLIIIMKWVVSQLLGNGEETTEAPVTTPEAPEPTPDDNGNYIKQVFCTSVL